MEDDCRRVSTLMRAACPRFGEEPLRRSSLRYAGLRGEGSTPVPLPPPMTLSPRFLRQSIGRRSPNKVELFESCGCTRDCRVAVFSARGRHFFQSFVLRHFSIVQKFEGREQQLAAPGLLRFESLSGEREQTRFERTDWLGRFFQ